MADDLTKVEGGLFRIDSPPRQKLLTVDGFVRMGEAGFFDEPGKHELWDGRVMMTPAPGPPHMDRESRTMEALVLAIANAGLREKFRVFAGGGLQIGEHNLRSPDLMVCTLPFDTTKRLTGEGVALVIEVAHSSLPDDLSEKRGKYAGAGIQEYWVVDVAHRLLHPFRNPKAGDYPECEPLEAGATISPLFAPQIALKVVDLV